MNRHEHPLGGGEDFLNPGLINAVDQLGAKETAVGSNDIGRGTANLGGSGGGLPDDRELVPLSGTGPAGDRASDYPLHVEDASLALDDHESARVLQPGGVGSVDGVGPPEAGLSISADSKFTGQRSDIQKQEGGRDTQPKENTLHIPNSTDDDTFRSPGWLKAIGVGMVFLIIGAMAFAIFEPIQVLPRLRLAPGFALTDQNGATFSSESARGTVTLYNFAPTTCDTQCQSMSSTMLDVQSRVAREVDLGTTSFELITVALNPSDPTELSATASQVSADGAAWRWVGTNDEENLRRVVGTGFQRFFETVDEDTVKYDPSFVLVDGNGVVRGEYGYSTLADDGEKLARHVSILAQEIVNSEGASAIAYEAAHLFLCYP